MFYDVDYTGDTDLTVGVTDISFVITLKINYCFMVITSE